MKTRSILFTLFVLGAWLAAACGAAATAEPVYIEMPAIEAPAQGFDESGLPVAKEGESAAAQSPEVLLAPAPTQSNCAPSYQGGANTVIITRGKQGVMAGRGGEYWQAGVYEMNEVVDPSGCGDAFAAGVVTGIVHGWDIQQTMRFASATGASAVRALGTTGGVFTFSQAQEFIAGNHLEIMQGKL